MMPQVRFNRAARVSMAFLLAVCIAVGARSAFAQDYSTPSTNPNDFVVGPANPDQMSSPDQTDQSSTGQSGDSTGQDLSPDQLDQFKNQYQSGSLSQDQFQELCARVAAKHLSDQDVQNMGASIGFAPDEIDKLQKCAQEANQGNGPPGSFQNRSQQTQNRNGIARQFELE